MVSRFAKDMIENDKYHNFIARIHNARISGLFMCFYSVAFP